MWFRFLLFARFFARFYFQDSCNGTPVTLRVDVKGFFLYWVDQNHEMDMLDIATIRDVRTGQYAKKPRVSSDFRYCGGWASEWVPGYLWGRCAEGLLLP